MTKSDLVRIIKEAVASNRVIKEEKSMDDILEDFALALNIQDDQEADQALKAVYAALKNKVKGKISGLANKARNYLDPSSTEQPLNENISPELEKKVNTFIKSLAKFYDYSEADAISGIKQVLAKKK